MFFHVSGVVFRNPADNFAGLRSGTCFRPKEDPGILCVYCATSPRLYDTKWVLVGIMSAK